MKKWKQLKKIQHNVGKLLPASNSTVSQIASSVRAELTRLQACKDSEIPPMHSFLERMSFGKTR